MVERQEERYAAFSGFNLSKGLVSVYVAHTWALRLLLRYVWVGEDCVAQQKWLVVLKYVCKDVLEEGKDEEDGGDTNLV